MWENLSYGNHHFLPVQESVIIIRDLIESTKYCGVQSDRGNTRLSEISLLLLVQGFVEISKRLIISYIGAEGLSTDYSKILCTVYGLYLPSEGTLIGDLVIACTR
jgi:hypothetical protein